MFYYLSEKIGDGTEENPYRPNYNDAFVWDSEHVCPICGTYIIALPIETNALQPITDLEKACNTRNLDIKNVTTWYVGDS